MQSGQQFKIDQPGLMKAAPIALIVAIVAGVFYLIVGLWTIAQLLGWIVPIFAGVWYVMTVRKASNALPAQMDGLVNGAIAGAAAGLVNGIVALIATSIAIGGLGPFAAAALGGFGIVGVITAIIFGAVLGAGGAFVYALLVAQGTIK
jgi:hypothetical protein